MIRRPEAPLVSLDLQREAKPVETRAARIEVISRYSRHIDSGKDIANGLGVRVRIGRYCWCIDELFLHIVENVDRLQIGLGELSEVPDKSGRFGQIRAIGNRMPENGSEPNNLPLFRRANRFRHRHDERVNEFRRFHPFTDLTKIAFVFAHTLFDHVQQGLRPIICPLDGEVGSNGTNDSCERVQRTGYVENQLDNTIGLFPMLLLDRFDWIVNA